MAAKKADYIDVREINDGDYAIITLRKKNGEPAATIEFQRDIGAMSIAPTEDHRAILRGPYGALAVLHEGTYTPLNRIVGLLTTVRRVTKSEDPALLMAGLDIIGAAYRRLFADGWVEE